METGICTVMRVLDSGLRMCREKVHAEARSNQNYHQEHEGHEEGVARECAQNIIVCFVLFVVNKPLRASACPFLAKQTAVLAMPVFPGQPCAKAGTPEGTAPAL